MPKVKDVTSLFSLCMKRITRISTTIYFTINVERSIQQSDSESDMNPFHRIPQTLLEVIISSLRISTKAAENFNIEFLITTELKKLIFPRYYHYKYENFLNFFPKLEKLQVLALHNSNVDNLCLKLIGTFCKNLRILNVNECSKLSDIGVKWFVSESPEMSKTLLEFMIVCPGVTKKGIKMAVQHFSALQVVESAHNFEVLVELIQSAAVAQHLPACISNNTFTRLTITIGSAVGKFNSGTVELVIKYCPLLFDIKIFVKKGFTDNDLFCLTNLKNLETLRILPDKYSDEDEITFDKALVPVLKVIGGSLKVLELIYFEFVDIWTIVKFCTNLLCLNFENQCQNLSALAENEITQLRNEKGRVIFKELKALVCGYNLTDDILFDLLSCPCLVNLYILQCDALTDEFFKEAISRNIFQHLKTLKLECCNNVTKEGLDGLLMSDDNDLEHTSFLFCDKVTKANVKDWHKFARHKNWEMYFIYEDDDNEPIDFY